MKLLITGSFRLLAPISNAMILAETTASRSGKAAPVLGLGQKPLNQNVNIITPKDDFSVLNLESLEK